MGYILDRIPEHHSLTCTHYCRAKFTQPIQVNARFQGVIEKEKKKKPRPQRKPDRHGEDMKNSTQPVT